jgi:alginate O-acetyltransferase complex protein AlgI
MVFSSLTFLFLFLPITLFAALFIRREFRNLVLLMASLVFYAWGEGEIVFILLLSTLFNYLFALWIDATRSRRSARAALALAVAFNLGLLGLFKYTNFLADNVNRVLLLLGMDTVEISPVHLPIGISFFTFQALSYVVDTYRKETRAERNPINTALYISLFPQLIAGPIVRYRDIARQLVERAVSIEKFSSGVQRFILGLGKKVLIANTLAAVVDSIFAVPAQDLTPGLAWAGVLGYSIQIYFDFSGYSDMAIGLGRMFGFEFRENFNYPYISRSIREFWRRWHISLSTWFRDYLYIPLGGNRISPYRTYLNLTVVFFLTGLWHGSSWNFVLWGFFHGMFLVIERVGFEKVLGRAWAPLRYLYALLVVNIGWVFFRSESIGNAFSMLKTMAGFPEGQADYLTITLLMDTEFYIVFIAGIIFSAPVLPYAKDLYRRMLERSGASASTALEAGMKAFAFASLVAVLLLSSMSLASGTYNPFIYFRF